MKNCDTKMPWEDLANAGHVKKKKKNVVLTKRQQPPAHLFNVPFSPKWYGIQLFFSSLAQRRWQFSGLLTSIPIPKLYSFCRSFFFLNGLFLGRKRFLVSCIRELKCVNMYLGQLQWPHLVAVYWIWNGLRHCKRVLCKSFSTMFQRKQFGRFHYFSCSCSFFFNSTLKRI